MGEPLSYVRLADHALLRRLELPYLYDRRSDELYELNKEGFDGLARCDGTLTLAAARLEPDFLDACLEAELLTLTPEPAPRPVATPRSAAPHSLRYLEVQATRRCDLRCCHCYLGDARPVDMAPETFEALCTEFDGMGGLRLLVSGGEPLLHPRWEEINAILAAAPVRRVLLSNGQRLDERTAASLAVDGVQLSIDGLRAGHEALRGPGSFERVVRSARAVVDAGLSLSIATMVHAGNLSEFAEMADRVRELGATEWSIDAPCVAGRLAADTGLHVTPEQAAKAMGYGFGAAYHGGNGEMACGLHLATVGADGCVAQCGFYFDRPLGHVREGLAAAWNRREPTLLAAIEGCNRCEAAQMCGGGCRYRASSPDRPDEAMCALYGVEQEATG